MNASASGLALHKQLADGWQQALREWHANVRLRWGLRLIVATVCVWLALLAQDQAQAWRVEADEVRSEFQRLQPLRAETQWAQRAVEAGAQLDAARALLWTAASQGQAEAKLQDTLREMCGKIGLPVRELTMAAVDAKPGADGSRPLRARLVIDMSNRLALMALLAEIGRTPQMMMVDSLRLRPQTGPARAEIEVRVLFRPQEKAP